MRHVVLDSNALRQDLRLERRGFEVLRRLADLEFVRVHVPGVVMSEVLDFVGSQHGDLARALRRAPKYLLDDAERVAIEAAAAVADTLTHSAQERYELRLRRWVRRTGGAVHPVAAHHGERVLQAYFTGRPPFDGVERRNAKEHFPDAFILEAIGDLSGNVDGDRDAARLRADLASHTGRLSLALPGA